MTAHEDVSGVNEREEPAPELLPCPFCGSQPKLDRGRITVHCMNVKCQMYGPSFGVEWWNRRDSKSRSPAPAPTPVEGWICRGGFYHGKTIERCMECGELQEDARHRIEVAGRSPAEVPPAEDTKRLDWLESKLSYRGNIELWGHPGERAHIALGEAETAVGLRNLRAAIDNAMQEAAVWRSAQQ